MKIQDLNLRGEAWLRAFDAGVWQNKSCFVAVSDSKYAQIFIGQMSPFVQGQTHPFTFSMVVLDDVSWFPADRPEVGCKGWLLGNSPHGLCFCAGLQAHSALPWDCVAPEWTCGDGACTDLLTAGKVGMWPSDACAFWTRCFEVSRSVLWVWGEDPSSAARDACS